MSIFLHVRTLSDDQLKRTAATVALCVAIFMVALKAVGYVATDSLGVFASLADSASDIVASLGTYFGIRTALRPADEDHRFGHGKAEAMAALGTAFFVMGSATLMLVEAFNRFTSHHVLVQGKLGIAIMVVSVVITYGLIRFQKYVVNRTGSTAIAADEVHYTADFAINAVVIVGLILTALTGFSLIDAIFGTLIAGWLVYQVIPVARGAIDMLMDKELPENERSRIVEIVRGHHEVRGLHDLRTRKSGSDVFIELHVEFDPGMVLFKVHAVGMQIENALRQEWPGADVVIHFDPEGVEEHRLDDKIKGQA